MMLWQRIGSALVAGPFVVWTVYVGGWPFVLLLAFMAVIAWQEMQLMQPAPEPLLTWLGWVLLPLVLYVVWQWPEAFMPAFAFSLFVLLLSMLWRYDTSRWHAATHALTSFCYLSLPLTYLAKLGSLPAGWRWVMLLLACVWSYDSCAFFIGSHFGKHKPWPHISPNKSLEGVAGGLVASSTVAVVAFSLLLPELGFPILLVYGIPFGLAVGLLAQTGDLLESAIKRTHRIKDSGRFLPGHGGILDRVDSMLLATPFVYYFLAILVL